MVKGLIIGYSPEFHSKMDQHGKKHNGYKNRSLLSRPPIGRIAIIKILTQTRQKWTKSSKQMKVVYTCGQDAKYNVKSWQCGG